MNVQRQRYDRTPLSLQDSCIYLAPDGALRPYAKTAEFLRRAGDNPDLADGRLLALHHVSGPHDVHYPVWEMHREGDELLILLTGSLSVESRQKGADRTTLLAAQTAVIVPAGIWHRLIVHEPSTMLAITPRNNTVLSEDPGR